MLFKYCSVASAGGTALNIPALAGSLSGKASSRIALLQLLCTGTVNTESQAAAAGASGNNWPQNAQQQRQQQHSGGSAANAADIRRFCGLSELHKAALCIVAAVLRCGDFCWAWSDVLTALDSAVGTAGHGIMSQPDLLLQTVLLYCQAEEQLAAELSQQAVQQDSVLLTDVLQQQQYGTGVSIASAAALAAAAAQLPVPGCILHALEKLGRSLPGQLSPNHPAAQWMLARAGQLPGAVQLLLQRWLAELLPGSTAGSTINTVQAEAPARADIHQQACAAIAGALMQHPAVSPVVLKLARSCFDNKQQLQLAGWLCVLTSTLYSSSSGNSGSGSDGSNSFGYQYYVGLQGASGSSLCSSTTSSSSSFGLVQQLLLGRTGVLELCRRVLLSTAGTVSSCWSSGYLVLCCNSCLLAAVVAVGATARHDGADATAAATAGALADAVRNTVAAWQQLSQQLLQHGIQQVSGAQGVLFACYVQRTQQHEPGKAYISSCSRQLPGMASFAT